MAEEPQAPEPPAQSVEPAAPSPAASATPRRRLAHPLALVAAAALAIGAYFAVKELTGEDDKGGTLSASGQNAYSVAYPASWRPLTADELKALPGDPIAVLRRKDGNGFVVIRRERRPRQDNQKFAQELTKELEKRLPDFQKRTSKTIKVRAGNAFFYSYIRRRTGTVHTIVIVPARQGSYVLNTVSSGGSQAVARDIGRMIVSFDA